VKKLAVANTIFVYQAFFFLEEAILAAVLTRDYLQVTTWPMQKL